MRKREEEGHRCVAGARWPINQTTVLNCFGFFNKLNTAPCSTAYKEKSQPEPGVYTVKPSSDQIGASIQSPTFEAAGAWAKTGKADLQTGYRLGPRLVNATKRRCFQKEREEKTANPQWKHYWQRGK